MTQSQHMQKSPKKIWATFPMLNFSRWTPTLGASLNWNDQKRPKLAHFGIFRHIGGVGGVQKNVDLKIQWVKGNCSKNCGYWASWGPTILFSEKKTLNVRITVHLDLRRCLDKTFGPFHNFPQLSICWITKENYQKQHLFSKIWLRKRLK